MSEHVNKIESAPADVNLLLRAHAELRCLTREVVPVVRQLETEAGLPEEQYGAAIAYLEVTWLEACRRALEDDAAHGELHARHDESLLSGEAEEDLFHGACRYYEAVKMLREAVARRVSRLLHGWETAPSYISTAAHPAPAPDR